MKHKATILLGMTFLFFLASYPYQHTFGGGLLYTMAGAAMAGGLADWFAVTALFRKPLGFPWYTAMIPRKRDQMFRAFAAMVQDDLLTGKHMADTIHGYDTTAVLLEYLRDNGGKRQIEKLIYTMISDMVRQGKTRQTVHLLNQMMQKNISTFSLATPVLEGISWLLQHKYDAAVVDFVLDELIRLIRQPQFLDILSPLLSRVQQSYEREKVRRKVFNQLFHLSAEQVARAIQHSLISLLEDMKQPSQPARRLLHNWLRKKMHQIRRDKRLQTQLDSWFKKKLVESRPGELVLSGFQRFFKTKGEDKQWLLKELVRLSRHFDRVVGEFAGNEAARMAADQAMKHVLCRFIENHGPEIGRIVRSSLEQFSNERLIGFIEDKVGNDLQMIRINGSLVGALAGGFIFLVDRAVYFLIG